MNGSLSLLIEGLHRALREEVAPALADSHARTQLAAVVDILGKLQGMVAWLPDAQRQQWQALQAGREAFELLAHEWGVASCLPQRASGMPDPDMADPETALRAAELDLIRQIDALFDAGEAWPAGASQALDTCLRLTLRESLLIERKRIPLTDFAAMSAATPPP